MSPFVVPHSITALITYALWAIALVVTMAVVRTTMVLRGRAKANSFTAGVPHGGDAYWRLNRAHLNTLENLPIFAAIVLSGWVVGMESAIRAELKKHRIVGHPRLSIVNASEVVMMDDPVEVALRRKKDSSMRVAINLVKEGAAHACVSAGNTGALMAVSRYILKTIPGVDRPAKARGDSPRALPSWKESNFWPAVSRL